MYLNLKLIVNDRVRVRFNPSCNVNVLMEWRPGTVIYSVNKYSPVTLLFLYIIRHIFNKSYWEDLLTFNTPPHHTTHTHTHTLEKVFLIRA